SGLASTVGAASMVSPASMSVSAASGSSSPECEPPQPTAAKRTSDRTDTAERMRPYTSGWRSGDRKNAPGVATSCPTSCRRQPPEDESSRSLPTNALTVRDARAEGEHMNLPRSLFAFAPLLISACAEAPVDTAVESNTARIWTPHGVLE